MDQGFKIFIKNNVPPAPLSFENNFSPEVGCVPGAGKNIFFFDFPP